MAPHIDASCLMKNHCHLVAWTPNASADCARLKNFVAQRRAFLNFNGAGELFQKTYDKKTFVGSGIKRDGRGIEQARA
jgi:REP element-mobilizing transposase RayT